ncbi:MAG: hypothetical protein RR254_00710 [Muribaculaceae bacterium]
MKKLQHLLSIAIVALSSYALTSCDSSYDLSKNLNTDITIGSNFVVPVGKTEKILLNRIIKTGTNIAINNEGIYEISADGKFNSQVAAITPVKLKEFNPFFNDIFIEIKKTNRASAPESIFSTKLTNTTTYNIDVVLPKEVESLSYAEFSAGNATPVKTSMRISIASLPKGVSSVHLKKLKIVFPEIFTIDGQNGNSIIFDDMIINANKLFVDMPILINGIKISKELESKYIKKIGNDKHLIIDTDLDISSDVDVSFNATQLESNSLVFKFAYIIPEISITKVGGKLVPDVKISESLSLGDIPDVIKGDGTKFTPSDIALNFDISNPINMTLATNLIITPWDNKLNAGTGKAVSVPLNINPSANSKFVISNTKRDVPAGYINIVNPELTSLLSSVPDSYRIESDKIIADSRNGNESIQLGNPYDMAGKYDIKVPFIFKDININYTDSIDNLVSDLKDVANKTNKIIVAATGVSTIPTDLEVSVKLFDKAGNELKGIDVELSKFKIIAAVGDKESLSPLEIILTEKVDSKDLELLDKILYTVKASSLDGKTDIVLKPTQYLLIKDIVAKIPEGINVEL